MFLFFKNLPKVKNATGIVENQKEASITITTFSNNTLLANVLFYKRLLFKASHKSKSALFCFESKGSRRKKESHMKVQDDIRPGGYNKQAGVGELVKVSSMPQPI